MNEVFLIFVKSKDQPEHLVGARMDADAAVLAAMELGVDFARQGSVPFDFVSIIKIPAGDWGATVDNFKSAPVVWRWARRD